MKLLKIPKLGGRRRRLDQNDEQAGENEANPDENSYDSTQLIEENKAIDVSTNDDSSMNRPSKLTFPPVGNFSKKKPKPPTAELDVVVSNEGQTNFGSTSTATTTGAIIYERPNSFDSEFQKFRMPGRPAPPLPPSRQSIHKIEITSEKTVTFSKSTLGEQPDNSIERPVDKLGPSSKPESEPNSDQDNQPEPQPQPPFKIADTTFTQQQHHEIQVGDAHAEIDSALKSDTDDSSTETDSGEEVGMKPSGHSEVINSENNLTINNNKNDNGNQIFNRFSRDSTSSVTASTNTTRRKGRIKNAAASVRSKIRERSSKITSALDPTDNISNNSERSQKTESRFSKRIITDPSTKFRRLLREGFSRTLTSGGGSTTTDLDEIPENDDIVDTTDLDLLIATSELASLKIEQFAALKSNSLSASDGDESVNLKETSAEVVTESREPSKREIRTPRMPREMAEGYHCNDGVVSFTVPKGWTATRLHDSFCLSNGRSLGFIRVVNAACATDALLETDRLQVMSRVNALSSPILQDDGFVAVNYTSHLGAGRGIAKFNNDLRGACVFGMCGPITEQNKIDSGIEELKQSATVVELPLSMSECSCRDGKVDDIDVGSGGVGTNQQRGV